MVRSITGLIVAAYNHAVAEAAGDIDAIMATMEGEPVYDFYPIARRFSGWERTRRYYDHFVAHVMQRITGYELHHEWVGEGGVIQEYSVMVAPETGGGDPVCHRVLGILTFGEDRLSGERLYADEAFFRMLLGPIWDELEPIG